MMSFKQLVSKAKNFYTKYGGLLAPYNLFIWKSHKQADRKMAALVHAMPVSSFIPNGKSRLVSFYQGSNEEAARALKGERQILHYKLDDPIREVDIKTSWEHDRMHHLLPIVIHRASNGEGWSREVNAAISSSSVFENTNAMEVAIAAINAITAYRMLTPEESEPISTPMGSFIRNAASYILENQEEGLMYSGNHYFFNLLGLMWIDAARGENDFQEAHDKMVRLLDQLILDDGALYEGSTYYHKYVTESLLLYLYEFQSQSEHSKLKQMAQKMMGFCKAASFKSTLVGIGDNDSGRILPLPFYFDYSSTDIGLLEKLAEALGIQSESTSKTQSRFGLYSISKGDFQAFIRLESDLGKSRRVIGNHCHNDQLHVEMTYADTLLLCDTGVYSYVSKDEHRIYPLQTEAHNTVSIKGTEQNVVVNSFDYVPRKVRSEVLQLEDDHFCGENTVIHNYPRTTHRRDVQILVDGVLIHDELRGELEIDEKVQVRFHFTPEWNLHQEGIHPEIWSIVGKEHQFRLSIDANEPGIGKGTVEEYEYSKEYGSREAAQCLCFELTNAAHRKVHIKTSIRLLSAK